MGPVPTASAGFLPQWLHCGSASHCSPACPPSTFFGAPISLQLEKDKTDAQPAQASQTPKHVNLIISCSPSLDFHLQPQICSS
ncbi:hypothetical protein CHARACLAT_027855 [Characodon lateralis]|uniref:Uncharacterized protein n=1 Tax=Characodon lateralis TaxID=208331 RepID=A0ABU7DYC5_9TELE|nr:hypothetical protein [Characodon lateralis]